MFWKKKFEPKYFQMISLQEFKSLSVEEKNEEILRKVLLFIL